MKTLEELKSNIRWASLDDETKALIVALESEIERLKAQRVRGMEVAYNAAARPKPPFFSEWLRGSFPELYPEWLAEDEKKKER